MPVMTGSGTAAPQAVPAVRPVPPVRRVSPLTWLGQETRGASVVRLIGSLVLFALIWELLARYLVHNRLILVPFTEVLGAMRTEIVDGQLWTNLWTTTVEILIAFPIGVVGGIAVGALLAGSKPLRQTLDPLLTALNSLPIVALAPLFVAGLGFGLSSKVIIVVLMAIFSVITSTDTGLRSADPNLVEAAQAFCANRGQVLRTVTLPHAVPIIVGGVRIAFARALVGVIVAEFFGAVSGVGFAIVAASQAYQTARLLGYVVIIGIVGLAASLGLAALERRLAPWRD
jgi:ABC-type nitrate/sulfonate/bicarbonate transport system permease component